jgi:hypothetical protein
MVENEGVCPIEGFYLLGVSTSRGKDNTIGCFGSGNKHSLLTLIRHGIPPIVFCGETRLEFFTKDNAMGTTQYKQLFMRVNGQEKELSMSLDFGSLDWDKVGMAMREFVSNALDAVDQQVDKVVIRCETPAGVANKTRVFVPYTEDVKEYHKSLDKHFLHFTGKNVDEFIAKRTPSPCRMYRRGVFIREVKGLDSLFDYNFQNTKIDECRNSDDWSAKYDINREILRNAETVGNTIIKKLVNGEDFFEINDCVVDNFYPTEDEKAEWFELWQKHAPKNAVISLSGHSVLFPHVVDHGFKPVIIKNGGWFKMLAEAGVPTAITALSNYDEHGNEVLDANEATNKTADEVWAWLEYTNRTGGKPKPTIKNFNRVIENNRELCGYVKGDIVYISTKHSSNHLTMLEEMLHYTSEASDMTRAFQDTILSFACAFVKSVW